MHIKFVFKSCALIRANHTGGSTSCPWCEGSV
jgi:hypothetical protein